MPLYEYECEKCGHRFEAIQKFSDPPLETCPKCGGPVHKLQSAPAFQFKGSGWYVTDYAKKSGSSGSQSDKPAEKSESSAKTDAASAKSDTPAKADAPAKTDTASKPS